MPRCVRNFWIELEVDGKKERIATGPRNSAGGFTLEVKMRNQGEVEDRVCTVVGRKDSFGNLVLTADIKGPEDVTHMTSDKREYLSLKTYRRP